MQRDTRAMSRHARDFWHVVVRGGGGARDGRWDERTRAGKGCEGGKSDSKGSKSIL